MLFFLIGAMTIVEVVDQHGGFGAVASAVRTDSRRALLLAVAAATFFLSAVLDNLTTTILMVSLLQVSGGRAGGRLAFGWVCGGGLSRGGAARF